LTRHDDSAVKDWLTLLIELETQAESICFDAVIDVACSRQLIDQSMISICESVVAMHFVTALVERLIANNNLYRQMSLKQFAEKCKKYQIDTIVVE
jgi:hypothetical protein